MKYLIKVSNFSKNYKVKEVVTKDFIITKNVTLIIGENGSGKSTIIKAICGFINYEGNIDINGKISYMSESPIFPVGITVNEFITRLKHISINSLNDQLIKNLFKTFKIEDKLDTLISSLSKGMKAKLNLIQCLMENVDIYILDEPLSGLDKEGVYHLINYIKSSNKSYIISTHLLKDFEHISDEVIIL